MDIADVRMRNLVHAIALLNAHARGFHIPRIDILVNFLLYKGAVALSKEELARLVYATKELTLRFRLEMYLWYHFKFY